MAEVLQKSDLTVSRVSHVLGARVEGFDLSDGYDQDTIATMRELLLDYHLIVLPNQELTPLELAAFGREWGELLTHPATKHRDTDFVQWIAGKNRKFRFFKGIHSFIGGWHSDMTWHHAPPHITGLHARKLPSSGGDTSFANQHIAYESLDDETKALLAGKKAFHTGKVFGPDVEDAIHPVVRTHNESGKKALYVNANFTRYILDMDERESERLLYRLFIHSSRPDFSYRHAWEVGDLVMWDNRSVMHYAISDYDEPRVMHRIVVKGDTPY